MNIEIANRLLQLRKEKGLSQEELAEKLGISRQSVSKWERAEASPDTDNLISLARLYGVSLDELLLDSGESQDEQPTNGTESTKGKKDNTKVHIGLDGVYVEDDDDVVNISWKDGVHIHEGGEARVVVDKGHVFVDGKEVSESKLAKRRLDFWRRLPFALIITAAFLLLGFVAHQWYWAWILFLLIPIYSSLISAIEARSIKRFAFPVLVTAGYLLLGMVWGLWHPYWLVFLLIPIWYSCLPKKKKNPDGTTYVEFGDDDDDDDDWDDDDDEDDNKKNDHIEIHY